jgi:predicted acetyltransferase
VASLQEDKVELSQTIGEMKQIQYQDQIRQVSLQSDLEAANKKIETTAKEVNKCKATLVTVEERLSTLSTREENNNKFDEIKSMLSGLLVRSDNNKTIGAITLRGKRKEQSSEIETAEEEHSGDRVLRRTERFNKQRRR